MYRQSCLNVQTELTALCSGFLGRVKSTVYKRNWVQEKNCLLHHGCCCPDKDREDLIRQ